MDFSATHDVSFMLTDKAGVKKRVRANKVILSLASPVFKAMFASGLPLNDDIPITDFSAEGFMEFLQLFYKSEVDFTVANMFEVLRLVDHYQIRDKAIKIIEDFFLNRRQGDSDCYFFHLAKTFGFRESRIKRLEDHVRLFAVTNLLSPTFPWISKATLVEILSWDVIFGEEKNFFEAAIYWAKGALGRKGMDPSVENIKEELGEAIKLIRFPTLSAQDFGEILEKYPNILEPEVSADIMDYIKEKKPLTVAGEYSIEYRRLAWLFPYLQAAKKRNEKDNNNSVI